MINQEKDTYLETAYEHAEALYKNYGAETAYQYLLNIIYYRLHGEFREEDF